MRQTAGGYSLTLTDANGVGALSVCFPGWRYTDPERQSLTAEAASGAWQELTFTALPENPPDSASCFFRLFYLDENNQTLASPRQGQYTHGTGSGLFSKSRRQNSPARRPFKNRGQRKRGGLLL